MRLINIIQRLRAIFFFLLYSWFFKHLDFRATLFFSVRCQGKKYISIGGNSIVQRGGWLLALPLHNSEPKLTIGRNCSIGDYSHITAVSSVLLEDDVLIANNVYISDNVHAYQDVHTPIQNQPVIHKGDVRLGSGCWIGENVCIIGASVGRNSVIGANSVVVRDIEDYCVAVGSPAKVIKRFNFNTGEWTSV